MSMLAERKRKTKWVINSTKKPLWTSDLNGIKFGKELMEKMGWSAGKGLGINEQGIQEPLRVSYKNDTKGMGFKQNDDDWIEQQNEFNAFLSQLRNGDDSSNTLNVSEKEIKSLEEKSKMSKARVHYQKFTRGKDLSRYSENDLACILGTNKTKKEKSKSEEVNQNESKNIEKCETSFGVTTINSGSLQDYFKKKWIFDKNSSSSSVQNAENNENPCQSFSNTESSFTVKNDKNLMIKNEEKKYKKRKYKSHCEEKLMGLKTTNHELHESKSFENDIKNEKKSKKTKNNLEEPKAKKQKKYCDFNVVLDETLGEKNYFGNITDSSKESESLFQNHENNDFNLVNKRKRNQQYLKLKSENDIDCIVEKKKRKSHENFVSDGLPLAKTNIIKEKENILEEELIKVKKNKKSKKEKLKESDGYSDNENVPVNNQTGVNTRPTLENSSVKKKKKKACKKKMANSEKIETNEFNVIPNGESNKQKSEKLHISETLEINSVKQKKKKKHFKEQAETESIHIEEELEEKKIGMNEKESEIKAEFVKKKKKKKDKEKKTESINCYSNHTEESLVKASERKNDENYEKNFAIGKETKKKKKKLKDEKKDQGINYPSDLRTEFNSRDKITNEVIITTIPQENLLEGDLVNKKKQRKKKGVEKDIDCCGLIEEVSLKNESNKKNISIGQHDYKLEVKLLKDKNKNKVTEGSGNCGYIKETLQKKDRCENEHEFIVQIESTKKKKEKKVEERGQKINYPHECTDKSNSDAPEEKNFGTKNEENSLDLELFKDSIGKKERVCKNEEKTQVEQSIKKPSIEAVNKRVNFSSSRNIEFHDAINDTMEEHKGVHKHKVAFLNEKTADKFYPGGYDRVLRLLFLSNIAGFKGSNLEGIAGYGQRKKREGYKSR